jgi:hypothetical protein
MNLQCLKQRKAQSNELEALRKENVDLKGRIEKVSKFFSNKKIIQNRAEIILNDLITTEARQGRIYLASVEIREMLRDIDEKYRLDDVENPSKAVIDVMNRVKKLAGERGIAIEMKKSIGKKIWILHYTPVKNLPTPRVIVKKIKEKARQMQSWAKACLPQPCPEDKPLSFSELWKRNCSG